MRYSYRFAWIVAHVVVVVSFFCLMCPVARADDLLRMRLLAPPGAAPGTTFEVMVVLDAVDVCLGEPLPLGEPQLLPRRIGFQLTLPAGFAVADFQWVPEVADLVSGPGGFLGARVDGDRVEAVATLQEAITGSSRPLAVIALAVPAAALPGPRALELTVDGVLPFIHTGLGAVRPHLRGAELDISWGPVLATTGGPIPFPEPSPAELAVQWIDTPADPAILSGAAGGAAGPSGGPDAVDQEYCVYLDKGQLDQLGYQTIAVSSLSDVSTAFDLWKDQGIDTIILLSPGYYTGSMIFDTQNMNCHIIIASRSASGPADTTIDGAGAQGPIIIRSGGPSTICAPGEAKLSFGWHEAATYSVTSPFDPLDPGPSAADLGMRGFEITGGSAYAVGGGAETGTGVVIDQSDGICPEIEVRGCYIHDNDGANLATLGGGVCIYWGGADIRILRNDISSNQATRYGGGIGIRVRPYVEEVYKITVAKCWIYDNTAGLGAAGGTGGGIYASQQDVDICSNFIVRNTAKTGCGIHYHYEGGPGTVPQTVYIEDNDVGFNVPLGDTSGSFGGGIAIDQSTTAPVDPALCNFGIVRNRIFDNGLTGGLRVEDGGGMTLRGDYTGAPGPYQLVGATPSGQLVIGNAVHTNYASIQAGGVALEAASTDPNDELRFHTNTIWRNDVLNAGVGVGTGLFIDVAVTGEFLSDWDPSTGSIIAGTGPSSNIVHGNLPASPPPPLDWYTDSASLVGLFEYSFRADCSTPPGSDIFEPMTCSFSAPSFVIAFDERSQCHQTFDSETVDSGEDDLFAGQANRLQFDFDGEPREDPVTGLMDAGADEWKPSDFVRGDANDDGSIDIADGGRILDALFVVGSPPLACLDAGDTNDDGNFDISDSVYILIWLFSGAAPPPPPFPGCGPDPTLDGMLCNYFVGCP